MNVGEGGIDHHTKKKAQTGGGKLDDQRNLFCSASGHQMRANEEGREAFFFVVVVAGLLSYCN